MQQSPLTDPNKIIKTVMGYREAKILLVAMTYDVFSLVYHGHRSIRSICSQINSDERATQILMDSLVSLEYLTKENNYYSLTEISRQYLVKDQPRYLGNNLKYQEIIWDAWSDLKQVVKTGKPARPLEEWLLKDDQFGIEYIHGMKNISKRPAKEIADLFKSDNAETLLDVGGGPGAYTQAFLNSNPNLEAYILDLPRTVTVAKNILEDDPHSKKIHFISGNYHTTDFGHRRYDLILMSHITHDEGERENKNLIRKSFYALKPGGHLIIHDFMTDIDRTSPSFSALFSVHMLVYTNKGRVYSIEEYESWLGTTGFNNIGRHQICKESLNASIALVATRPSS